MPPCFRNGVIGRIEPRRERHQAIDAFAVADGLNVRLALQNDTSCIGGRCTRD